MLRMPRKTSRRCSKCCACHAKRNRDAPSAAPATQNEAAPKSITLRQTSAHLYDGAPSAAHATQNEPDVLQVPRLPRKTKRRPKASLFARLPPTSMKVLQSAALPRETSPRCSKCSACHAKRGGAQKHHSSPDFRRPL